VRPPQAANPVWPIFLNTVERKKSQAWCARASAGGKALSRYAAACRILPAFEKCGLTDNQPSGVDLIRSHASRYSSRRGRGKRTGLSPHAASSFRRCTCGSDIPVRQKVQRICPTVYVHASQTSRFQEVHARPFSDKNVRATQAYALQTYSSGQNV
jgi:hypothetical protein